MKKVLSKEDKKLLDLIAQLPCIVCGSYPVHIHHLRNGMGMGQRNDTNHAIPLCPQHHQHGGYGIAIHAGQKTFEKNFGSELELLLKTQKLLEEKD